MKRPDRVRGAGLTRRTGAGIPLLLSALPVLLFTLPRVAEARHHRRPVGPAVVASTDPEEAPETGAHGPRFRPDGTPAIQGKCALLIDTRSGAVLWDKNARARRPMASLTKVMTALLILESGRLDDVVTASPNANQTPNSSIYLAVGEKLKLRDLLWAILMRSANDACVAAAEHLDGSVPRFVAHMNRRARQLGLKDTHFVTPNGLNAPGHYSTCVDLARITLEDMKFPLFNEMVRTKKHVIQRSIRKQNATLISRSRILWRWPPADGVKTGYTRQAGHCFIGSATANGWRLLSVILNSPHVGDDTRSVLEYGFRAFRSVPLAAAGRPVMTLPVSSGRDARVPVGVRSDVFAALPIAQPAPAAPRYAPTPERLRAPVDAGAPVSRAVWSDSRGGTLADVPLVALKADPAMPGAAVLQVAWWPLALLLLLVGAVRYGAGTKDHRQRRRNVPKRGRGVGRGR